LLVALDVKKGPDDATEKNGQQISKVAHSLRLVRPRAGTAETDMATDNLAAALPFLAWILSIHKMN
jgi:hypothetical protein